MSPHKKWYYFLLLITIITSTGCNGQSANNKANSNTSASKTTASAKPVGGGCDGCELMFAGIPAQIDATDTSEGWNEPGRKLILSGRALKKDGTPAKDVIIYYWHTDNKGYYSPKDGMPAEARRHGHLRGWVKTGADGRYTIYTIRPLAYPDGSEPEHIHISIKEPDIPNEYYTDELLFEDDPLLAQALKRRPPENRGGSGILQTTKKEGLQTATHDFILGLNIPNYPSK